MIALTKAIATNVESPHLSPTWIEHFQNAVLIWFASHGRKFPWRHATNPFHILIAEVLLRQTQAERVAGPYLELVERYPEAYTLAQADVGQLREWFKPLGLVNRADRLVKTAQILVEEHGGTVPCNLDSLMNLPGLGRYSARAVLCMSFGKKVPMIDEASGRLLRRVFGASKRQPAYSDPYLFALANQLLPSKVQQFNLSLIDIASACCHSRRPNCLLCPLSKMCKFYENAGQTSVDSD